MTASVWVFQRSPVPSPADLAAYLLQHEWRFESTTSRWATYAKQVDGENVVLEVPQQTSAADYGRAIGVFLDDLARLERRPPALLLRNIKSAAIDIVRLAIEGSTTRDGRIPVEAGRRVYDAQRPFCAKQPQVCEKKPHILIWKLRGWSSNLVAKIPTKAEKLSFVPLGRESENFARFASYFCPKITSRRFLLIANAGWFAASEKLPVKVLRGHFAMREVFRSIGRMRTTRNDALWLRNLVSRLGFSRTSEESISDCSVVAQYPEELAGDRV